MSAYDNPTIIKDDSAMAWAQATAGFTESFEKSFEKSREARDVKEKELRLINEKKEKESNQLILEQQRVKQGYDNESQRLLSNSVIPGIPKDDPLMAKIQKTWGSQLNKAGEDNTLISTTIQSKKFKDDALDYNRKAELGRATTIETFGASTNQVNTYGAMTADATRGIVWTGDTGLDQLNNMMTCNALNPNNLALRGKVNKDYISDPTDPSKNKLKVSTEIGDKAALKEKLKIFYVGASQEELDEAIEKGIKENKIIQTGDNYKLNFEQEIGQGTWDGTFYKSIPEITTENLFSDKGANIMDPKTQRLNEDYLTQVSMRNLGKNVEGQVQYIKIGEVLKVAKPIYLAEATGLLEGPLSDNTMLRGYLTNRVDDGKIDINNWMEKFNTVELRREALARLIMQKDIKTKLGSEYSSMPASPQEKAKGLADFNNNVWTRTLSTQEIKKETKTAPEKTAAQIKKDENLAEVEKMKKAPKGQTRDFHYDGRKISWDGSKFIIKTEGSAGKDSAFATAEEAIAYITNE